MKQKKIVHSKLNAIILIVGWTQRGSLNPRVKRVWAGLKGNMRRETIRIKEEAQYVGV